LSALHNGTLSLRACHFAEAYYVFYIFVLREYVTKLPKDHSHLRIMVNAIILLNKIFKLVNLVQQLPVLLYKLVILIERGEEIIVSPGAQWFACELKSCSDQASTITLLEAWLLIP
tara:strand:- start:888 stop:1235 length:348 start_codon:yes stop_codon:yes gene_type:complete